MEQQKQQSTEATPSTIAIESEGDIIEVRMAVRDLAKRIGFGVTDATRIVTAASELARNIVLYAGFGMMQWRQFNSVGNSGLELVFIDRGPGIPDIKQAMEVGYSSGGGLGMGLPGSKRLMDEFEIESEAGKGTTVRVRKWLKRQSSLPSEPLR